MQYIACFMFEINLKKNRHFFNLKKQTKENTNVNMSIIKKIKLLYFR